MSSIVPFIKQTLPILHAKGELGLPPGVSIDRFVNAAAVAALKTQDLGECSPESVVGALRACAVDGLVPDGRDAALVVFRTKHGKQVQYMPMIGGLLRLARNSGELASVSAHVVYEADDFEYVLGDEERITHRPARGERGAPVYAYAVGKTKDRAIYREVMTVEEIEKVRSVSRAGSAGPWVDWWERMAEKTVLRRLLKRMPMASDALSRVLDSDDKGYDFDGVVTSQPARPALSHGLQGRIEAAKGKPRHDDEPPPDVPLWVPPADEPNANEG